MKAQRESRDVALLFLWHQGRVVNATTRPLYSAERDPVPDLPEAGWAPGPVWMGAQNLAPTGVRSPDRPVRSESLYRLRYHGLEVTVTDSLPRNEIG